MSISTDPILDNEGKPILDNNGAPYTLQGIVADIVALATNDQSIGEAINKQIAPVISDLLARVDVIEQALMMIVMSAQKMAQQQATAAPDPSVPLPGQYL